MEGSTLFSTIDNVDGVIPLYCLREQIQSTAGSRILKLMMWTRGRSHIDATPGYWLFSSMEVTR